MVAVVQGRVFGEEAFAGGGDKGVTEVGEDAGGAAGGGVLDYADAELVGGAFEAEGEHCDGWVLMFVVERMMMVGWIGGVEMRDGGLHREMGMLHGTEG